MIFKLALSSLANRKATAVLTLISLTISVILLLGIDHLRQEARSSFAQAVSGTDLIVGARSGSVNLLLYSVFHIGSPSNNISWDSYQELQHSPEVAWAIPISLGDSHLGYRVVGTSTDMFEHFRYARDQGLSFETGQVFEPLYQVVLGSRVAAELNYSIGQEILLSHGTGAVSFSDHSDKPFIVSGILKPTGTPIDQSLLTSLESIEAIHVGWQEGFRVPGFGLSAQATREIDLTPTAVTAIYIGLTSRMATFGMQRAINDFDNEALTAILPGVALSELWSTLGNFENLLLVISALVLVSVLIGMATMLLASLNERRRELAILRAVGARPLFLLTLVELEVFILAFCAYWLGWLGLNGSLIALEPMLVSRWGIQVDLLGIGVPELLRMCMLLGCALLVGLAPAIAAYRKSVADGLIVRT